MKTYDCLREISIDEIRELFKYLPNPNEAKHSKYQYNFANGKITFNIREEPLTGSLIWTIKL